MRNESYVLEDIYFNYFKHNDPKPITDIKFMIRLQREFINDFYNIIDKPNIKFICNSASGWSRELENKIKMLIV